MAEATLTGPVRSPGRPSLARLAAKALDVAGAFWLATALVGQWAFAAYIAAFYGVSTLGGHMEAWNRLKVLGRTPYVAGDSGGNLAYAAHALAAGIIAFGGALQLMPLVRSRAPALHRWNGRLFVATVVGLSLSGFYLVWIRHTSPDRFNAVSTTFNGVLILVFAGLAWRSARARDFAVHRRWAMRLYLVSNAQWFLRVGVFGYFALNQVFGRKIGLDDPALIAWVPGCYLAPLGALELYLRAKASGGPKARLAVAGLLVLLTLIMAVGVLAFGAFSQMIVSGAPLKLPK